MATRVVRATCPVVVGIVLAFALPSLRAGLVQQRSGLPAGVQVERDIEYARLGDRPLRLDLYVPERAERPLPLVVWIHDGGWRAGNKRNCRLLWLTGRGYAVASVEYRLSTEALFPAQIHDCKGAVRWLRAHATEYGLDAERFAVAGASAGGHLAALLGVSAGVKELEGSVGGNSAVSSRVKAVVDFFGPTDLVHWINSPEGERINRPGSPVALLLGGLPSKKIDLARLASPVTHVTRDDPPILIVHGSADPVVPVQQSTRLAERYREAGLTAVLHIIEGARHGGPEFDAPPVRRLVLSFLNEHLRGKKE